MKPRVLIVDDSFTVRMDLGEAFGAAGFESTLCSTVSEARGALSSASVALILLDVHLPDADGIEFLQEIKSSAATSMTPVMLLSSEVEVRDRIRGLQTGADEYVGKPYDLSYVMARARQLLRKQELEGIQPLSRTVLIIDDSPTFCEALKAELESSSYKVITAATGEDGLRVAVHERPSAIIVDGILPGIDGATVIRRIRADGALRRTPCILLTASDEQNGEIFALDAGADDYVRKEENTEIILARLTAVLRTAGAPSAARPAVSLLAPKKVLVVDDSLTYLQEIAAQLRQEGYDVISARSGEDALELLSVQIVDCILLDLVMPGISGQETCRRIKASSAWRNIPLIMHTGLEEQEAMVEGINAGADDYIAKSSDIGVLHARLRAQLRRKQFEDENRSIREQLLQKELEVSAANAARQLAETRATFAGELEEKNQELEAFSYSVCHDLRAPLRGIDGFSKLLIDKYGPTMDAQAVDYLTFLRAGAKKMSDLIDDLLTLSQIGRARLMKQPVDVTALAREVIDELQQQEPARQVYLDIAEALTISADAHLLKIVLTNLFGNAWKYTRKQPSANISLTQGSKENETALCVRDNGTGFDMAYADKLFVPFQRLHHESEFEGTGIGLATVHRIITRHGGRIWAEATIGEGAAFFFTLGNPT